MSTFSDKIPPALIKEMAQNFDMSMTNYYHPIEQKLIMIPKECENFAISVEEYLWQKDLDTIKSWGTDVIKLEPMESYEKFKIMENFAGQITDERFRIKLENVLTFKKPFANFKMAVDNSDYRQDWFDFKQQAMEKYVREMIDIEMDAREL